MKDIDVCPYCGLVKRLGGVAFACDCDAKKHGFPNVYAVAPELLEALLAFCALEETMPVSISDDYKAEFDAGRAAITKANGK